MAHDATTTPIQELIDAGFLLIGDGYRAKNEELSKQGLPFARAQNINGVFRFEGVDCYPKNELSKVGNKVSQPGDVVFTSKGTVGRFAVVRDNTPQFVYSPQLCFWRSLDHGKIFPLWLFYWMQGFEFYHQYKGVAGQTDMAEYVSLRDQRSMYISLPSIAVQQAIAQILGTIDDKIELNRRINETLETMARAIFKSWFVDFDPVRAKMSGEPPESICRHLGLTSDLLDLFPDRLQDSELGEIPEGWEAGRISDVAGFLSGYAFKSKNWIEAGVPVVKIGSVKPGIVDLNAVSFVSDEVADEAKRFRLASGDLLIGMTGYVGEVGLVPITDKPPLLNQRVGKFILEAPGTSAMAFFYCLTRSAEFKSYVETKSHGTAQANVSADAILSISIVVPHKALRDKFNKICSPILDRILENHAESQALSAIRDSLLPKFLSGELRAPVEGEA